MLQVKFREMAVANPERGNRRVFSEASSKEVGNRRLSKSYRYRPVPSIYLGEVMRTKEIEREREHKEFFFVVLRKGELLNVIILSLALFSPIPWLSREDMVNAFDLDSRHSETQGPRRDRTLKGNTEKHRETRLKELETNNHNLFYLTARAREKEGTKRKQGVWRTIKIKVQERANPWQIVVI